MNIEIEFHKKKRNAVLKQLKENEMAVIASSGYQWKSADQFFPFRQDSNFYYLTGLKSLTPSFLLLSPTPFFGMNEMLVIPKPDPVKSKWDGDLPDQSDLLHFSSVIYLDEFYDKLKTFFLPNQTILFNFPNKLNQPTYHPIFDLEKKIKDNYPDIKIDSLLPNLTNLRLIKEEYEISHIKKAISVTGKAIDAMKKISKLAKFEYELEAEFRAEVLRNGLHHLGYEPIIASGLQATILHYKHNNHPIEPNNLILTDVGAECEGYSADITRVFSSSQPTKRQIKIYESVLKVNQEIIRQAKPGIVLDSLNQSAKELLAEEAIRFNLIKTKEEINHVYMHRVSHFLGLDVHDCGDYSQTLQPGMVITVEPGLYIENEKIGIRIEDNILITPNGNENLTISITKQLE